VRANPCLDFFDCGRWISLRSLDYIKFQISQLKMKLLTCGIIDDLQKIDYIL